MTALVSARHVSKRYATHGGLNLSQMRNVLDDVDFDLDTGVTLALLGRSGSGKSTLGRLLLGLEAPSSGEIRFEGRSLRDLSKGQRYEFRRSVQVVFQDSVGAVNSRHSIGRIVAEPLRHLTVLNAKARRDRVAELLVHVGLKPEDADKRPVQMSGGQLQRVCIARALAPSPRLVVLDEAVSNLDLTLQMQILALLQDLQRKDRITYLFVTHDLRLVRKFCHRVLVLEDGRVVEDRQVEPGMSFAHAAGLRLQEAVLPALPTAARGSDFGLKI